MPRLVTLLLVCLCLPPGTVTRRVEASISQQPLDVAPEALLERVVHWTRPVFPDDAEPGTAEVRIAIGDDGQLLAAEAASGSEPLKAAALDAVRVWRFRAPRRGEVREAIQTVLTFEFVEEYGWRSGTLVRPAETETDQPLPKADPPGFGNPVPPPPRPVESSLTPEPLRRKKIVAKARFLNSPRPNYTTQARLNGTTGTVQVKALFGRDGTVSKPVVTEGLPDGLNGKAVEAVRALRFVPGRDADGAAVDMWFVVAVNFTLR